MDPLVLGILVGVPLAWHLGMTGYAFWDAGRNDMDQRKWGTVSFLVPFFGFFAYVFERDEKTRDPEPDMFADGPYEVHESRADEAPLVSGDGDHEMPTDRARDHHVSERDGNHERP